MCLRRASKDKTTGEEEEEEGGGGGGRKRRRRRRRVFTVRKRDREERETHRGDAGLCTRRDEISRLAPVPRVIKRGRRGSPGGSKN